MMIRLVIPVPVGDAVEYQRRIDLRPQRPWQIETHAGVAIEFPAVDGNRPADKHAIRSIVDQRDERLIELFETEGVIVPRFAGPGNGAPEILVDNALGPFGQRAVAYVRAVSVDQM